MFETIEESQYLSIMQNIQKCIIKFLKENDSQEVERRFSNLTQIEGIANNTQIFKEMLHLLSSISNNCHRTPNSLTKIERIIDFYKTQISNFPKQQIFDIFKKNKRILLILFQKELLKPNRYLMLKIIKEKYTQQNYHYYFYPEFKSFYSVQFQQQFEKEYPDIELFKKNREIGENENYLCQLIRNDSIEDFISTVTRENLKLTLQIKPSIYETSPFLIGKKPTLIEYATFYGSIQIFNYLRMNKVDLTKSLWLYAIHGENNDIIHILEDNKIIPPHKNNQNDYYDCLKESILCHHNKLVNFFLMNYIDIPCNSPFYNEIVYFYFQTYNFQFITAKLKPSNIFFLCKFDYLFLAYQSLIKQGLNINEKYSNLKSKKKQISNTWSKTIETVEKKYSLLILAVKKGNCELVQLLLNIENIDVNLEHEFSIKKETNFKIDAKTPALFYAISSKNIKIIDLLLSNQLIDPNKKKITRKFNVEVIDDSNINRLKNKYNEIEEKTPLQLAIENRNVTIIDKLLLNKNIDVNEEIIIQKDYLYHLSLIINITALHVAAQFGNSTIFQKLIDNKIDTNKNYTMNVILSNQQETFPFELKTALFIAIENNKSEIVDILLNNNNNQIDLNHLIISSDTSYIYDSKKEVPIEEKTILHEVIERGQEEFFKKLLSSNKIDINALKTTKKFNILSKRFITISKMTALHISIQKKNHLFVQNLLENEEINPSINIFTKEIATEQKTTLYYAIEIADLEIIKILLLNQKSLDIINEKTIYEDKNTYKEMTSFHCAIKKENIEIVKMLIDQPLLEINEKFVTKTKDNTTKTKKLLTPLYYAISIDSIEIIKLLLESTNEINYNEESILKQKIINNKGNSKTPYEIKRITPLQQSIIKGNVDVINLLLNSPKIDINTKTLYQSRFYIYNNSSVVNVFNSNKSVNVQKSSIYQKEKLEKTALSIAIELSLGNLVDILLKHKKIKCNDKLVTKKKIKNISTSEKKLIKHENTILTHAISFGNASIVQKLLSLPKIKLNEVCLINQKSFSALKTGEKDINLIEEESKQETALTSSIVNKKIDIFSLLLNDSKIDKNCQLLFNKISYQNKAIKKIEKKSPLFIAIETKDCQILKLLIDNISVDVSCKLSVDCISNSNLMAKEIKSAVYFAVEQNEIDVLKTLLSCQMYLHINFYL